MAGMQKLVGGINPRRVQDMTYRMRAQLALGDDAKYQWLCDRSTIVDGKPKSWRPAVLSELGHLLEEQGKETMIALAAKLCELGPSTKEALGMIREVRLSQGAPESLELAAAIIQTVEGFLTNHLSLDRESIAIALDNALFYLLPDEEES